MKDVRSARFVPTYYNCDLFKKLQQLKQGTKSVEEYYKEMEISMIRANVTEDDEQTMARFFNGLNHPIKKIADFQPYSNLMRLVHQAYKVHGNTRTKKISGVVQPRVSQNVESTKMLLLHNTRKTLARLHNRRIQEP